ncbi:MAG: HAD family phosphatase [Halanaerobiales bacterium]|nr:HAD family phosphatase [Halanaerobiales bacterium]
MLSGIKAVIFDMDGTLIDSMGIWKEIDHDFLSKREIPVPKTIQKEIEGKSFTETAEYFKERFELSESVEEIIAEWIKMCKAHYKERVLLKPGAAKLVKYLHQMGFKIGMGTSSQRELVETVLEQYGLTSYFDSVRTSCEVGRGKPYPDIFLKVAEDLEIEPEKCLVFEDTLAGIQAAKSAGMRVIAVYDDYSVPFQEEILAIADGFIEDFEEIA